MIKVWDSRLLGGDNKQVGNFFGHSEGVTHVVGKGDGRYIASNGKDQLLKVWDLRKMLSNDYIREIQIPPGT